MMSARRSDGGVDRGACARHAELAALVIGLAATSLLSACGNAFDSCEVTRTCPSAARGSGGAADASTSAGGGTGLGGSTSSSGGSPSTTGGARGAAVDGAASASPPPASPDAAMDARVDAAGRTADAATEAGAHPDASTAPDAAVDAASDAGPPRCTAGDPRLLGDPEDCGACGHACSSSGVITRSCDQGACKPTCDATHLDCDGSSGPTDDGCEVDAANDPAHCGACDVACAAAGTTATACVQGACKPTCDATHLDCDGKGENGCEVDVKSDPDNCGQCRYACSGAHVGVRRCVQGACSPTCSSGYGDCAAASPAPDDGCETNLGAPTDCGACGHDCLGGQCSALKCQEITLASNLPTPRAIAVDGSYVHWVDGGNTDGRVMRTSLFGQGTTTIATSQALPMDIVSSGGYVYWTNGAMSSGAVRRHPSGGTPTVPLDIATSAKFAAVVMPAPLAVDATYVYWGDAHFVYRMSKDGTGSPLKINSTAVDVYPTDIAVDGTSVFAAAMGLFRIPLSGDTTPVQIGDGDQNVALDASYVYATSGKSLLRLPKAATSGQTAASSTSVSFNTPIAVDGTSIYFAAPDGIYRASKSGGAAVRLSASVTAPVAIVVTTNAIYWANQGATGTILKLAL